MARWLKYLLLALVLGGLAFAAYEALRPKPIPVDIAVVTTGPLTVTVDEEGIAQYRDVYTVSAPYAARTERSPLHVGDRLVADRSLIATLHPIDPSFIDMRSERELAAAVGVARAGIELAETDLTFAATDLKQAESELQRAEKLQATNIISAAALEAARTAVELKQAALQRAENQVALRQSELVSAQVRLIQPDDAPSVGSLSDRCVPLLSPTDGVVISVPVESEAVVPAGTALAEIGDPRRLEVVVDLLSSDAVRVRGGARAIIADWGGPDLTAKVRRIEPTAFTKVSALGIEEQRVNVRLDMDPTDAETPLPGHRYRVFVRIALWQADAVRRVPLGALFRSGDAWNVYVVEDGRAVIRTVDIDHRDDAMAELRDGLPEGARVILFPSDSVTDGVSVVSRDVDAL